MKRIALLLLPVTLSAQTAAEWLLHPTLSVSALVAERYVVQDKAFKNNSLGMIKAGFGDEGCPFRVSVTYDILSVRFITYEAVWQPVPQIGVRVGLQKMTFQVETTFSPNNYGIFGYSQAASMLGGYSGDLSGVSSRARDFGVVLQGSFFPSDDGFSRLSYALGLFNGNGYNIRDNNTAKDIQGRLIFQPWRHLRLSVGGMYGHFTPDGTDRLADRHRISTGIWFDNGTWFMRSENIYGITDKLHSDGIMAFAGWWFRPRMLVASRVDRFQRDLSDPLSTSTKVDICFRHHLTADGAISYTLQYGHTFFSNPALPGTDQLVLCVSIALSRKL